MTGCPSGSRADLRGMLLLSLLLTGAWGVPLHVDKTLSPMQRWAELSPWLGPAPSVPACRWLNFQRFIFTLETSAEWIDSTAEAFACSPAEPTPEQRELLNRMLPGQELLRVFCPEQPLTMLRADSESGYAIQDMLLRLPHIHDINPSAVCSFLRARKSWENITFANGLTL